MIKQILSKLFLEIGSKELYQLSAMFELIAHVALLIRLPMTSIFN